MILCRECGPVMMWRWVIRLGSEGGSMHFGRSGQPRPRDNLLSAMAIIIISF